MRMHLFVIMLLTGLTAWSQNKPIKYKVFEAGGDRGFSDNVAPMTDEHFAPANRDELQSYLRLNSVGLVKGLRRSQMHSNGAGWHTLVALDTAESGRVAFLVYNETRREKFDIQTAPADTTWTLGTFFLGVRK